MPTTFTNQYSGTRCVPVIDADDSTDSQIVYKLKASTTFAAGQVVGEILASPGTVGPYATGNSDGTQLPIGILEYGAVTDSSSKFATDEWGATQIAAAVWTKGTFRTQDLTGLDAGAVTAFKGRLLEGTVSTGIVRIP